MGAAECPVVAVLLEARRAIKYGPYAASGDPAAVSHAIADWWDVGCDHV